MIESPCNRHCCLDQNDICLGCRRSLEEIRQWAESDPATKQTILDNARQRRHNDCARLNTIPDNVVVGRFRV